MADHWASLGFGVLAYDFPGYGLSSGTPTEKSCEAAIEAAWVYLTTKKELSESEIVIIGRSVGSGPSVWLSAQHRPAGLILISPFTSIYAVRIPYPIFPRDRFPNLARIPKIQCPLLVLHGAEDTLIPPSHGRRLLDAAVMSDKQFLEIPGVGHNDLDLTEESVETAIVGFAKRVSNRSVKH